MSVIAAMAMPAIVVSALAALVLVLLPAAPPRVRYTVAVTGLAAWLVPWPWLTITVDAPAAVQPFAGALAAVSMLEPRAPSGAGIASALAAYVVLASFGVGAALFAADVVALRRTERRWRAASRAGETLRDLLPTTLRRVRAEIRSVRGTRVAAASGWLNPTIWIGEGFSAQERELALLHEACHVQRADAFRIALISAIRRAYWWNPLVAYLAREAALMIEGACDERCARVLGRETYIARLAALVLARASAPPRLVPAMRGASFDMRRLELLRCGRRLRTGDHALLTLVALTAVAATSAHVIRGAERHAAHQTWSRVAIPATPAGRALESLLAALNAHDSDVLSDYLGAYTPQERGLPFDAGAGGVELVEITRSEPLRITYVVQDAKATRHAASLELEGSRGSGAAGADVIDASFAAADAPRR